VITGCIVSLFVATPLVVGAAWTRVALDTATPSRSVGTVEQGRLEHGHVIPPCGDGYTTYSYLGAALGRQYVHGSVRDTLTAAFAARAQAEPGRVFVLGETGHRHGGRFRPHRTHRNGLSVDVFVPVNDAAGPTTMPTWPWLRFGYDMEFDREGRAGTLRIEFESLAALLEEFETQARQRGLRIARVILAPEYLPQLLDTAAARRWPALGALVMRRPAWVRHDEHVHVDFAPVRNAAAPR
jgi:penicillin-insensitive murein endopeptidase